VSRDSKKNGVLVQEKMMEMKEKKFLMVTPSSVLVKEFEIPGSREGLFGQYYHL
jgi:hypothetical protein